jgi:hypothetical protein
MSPADITSPERMTLAIERCCETLSCLRSYRSASTRLSRARPHLAPDPRGRSTSAPGMRGVKASGLGRALGRRALPQQQLLDHSPATSRHEQPSPWTKQNRSSGRSSMSNAFHPDENLWRYRRCCGLQPTNGVLRQGHCPDCLGFGPTDMAAALPAPGRLPGCRSQAGQWALLRRRAMVSAVRRERHVRSFTTNRD